MPVQHISDVVAFRAALAAPQKLVVVDFHASWCGPCHAIAPLYERLSDTYAARAAFLKVDVDAAADIARLCAVSAMPTFQFYLAGRKVAEFSGADQARLQAEVERLAPSAASLSFASGGNRLGSSASPPPAHVDSTAAGAAPDPQGPAPVAGDSRDGGGRREALAAAAAKRYEAAAKKQQEILAAERQREAEEKAKEAQEPPESADALPDASPAEPSASTEEATAAPAEPSTPTPTPASASDSAAVDAAPAPLNDTRLKVNDTYLRQLTEEMGFPRIRAEKALILTGNASVERAVEWCFEHADDADVDEPLQLVTSEGDAKPKLSAEEAKRKADDLYARARARREETDKLAERDREKERLRTSREATIAKAKHEEAERHRAVEEKKREKRQALADRQRVRQMLEDDKARRRTKFHMPPSVSGAPAAPAPAPAPAQPVREQPPRNDPSTAPGKIQFRLPDGSRIEGEFQADHTIADLIAFLVDKRPELGAHALQFSQQYPRKTFAPSEYGVSLSELRLLPRGALTVTF